MPRTTGRTYSALRFVAPLILVIHLGVRLIFTTPTVVADLILYNLVALIAALSILGSPRFNDRWAKLAIFLSIFIWTIGSVNSSWNEFFSLQLPGNVTDIAYGLFYPLALFGIVRSLTINKRLLSLELFDTLIVALGSTSVIASLLLKLAMHHIQGNAFSVFLSIFYPIADVVIVAISLALFLKQKISLRTLCILVGITLFAASDLYFLWISNRNLYSFGALTDDGWLLALILLSESFWHQGGELEVNDRINNFTTAISLILSSTILAAAALRPNYFPAFVLIPGFSTIILAFIRMAIAIRDAKQVVEERELARTDELTGLPNRRRFLAELDLLTRREGTLLILDLNGFKKVNDEHGHGVGDQLLRQVANRFSRTLPTGALLARLGGDEFGVIIYGSAQLGHETALALRAALSYPFLLSVGEASVGVSIGSCVNNPEISSKENLLRAADSAMYEAKRSLLGLVERGK